MKYNSLSTVIEKTVDRLEKNIIDAQNQFTEDLAAEIRNAVELPSSDEAQNPSQFIPYRDSIKAKPAEKVGDSFVSEVYSDYTVYWEKKGINVPLGNFLEWGTGPIGESTNTYPHGYEYTTDKPWDTVTLEQWFMTDTWGMQARPHWYPTVRRYKDRLKEEIENRL